MKLQYALRHTAAVLLLLATCTTTLAQELEYALELGVMGGPMAYFGDANYGNPLKNLNGAAAVFGRYNINPRMSVKFNVAYGKVSGDASKSDNKYPDVPGQKWDFSNPVVDVGAQYELGFWGYGAGGSYKGTRRLTPYLQLGLGVSVCNKQTALNIPLGFGVKFKFAPRWNAGVDWSVRFTTADKMDGIADPYGLKSGAMKNKDSYSMLMFYISYDLCPKYRKCNNE